MPIAAPSEPPGLEQIEWQHLREQRRRHVEAAAVEIEIDEGQRAGVMEARGVEREQQVAVLRVGEVVPAQSIVAEGERGDHSEHRQDDPGQAVGQTLSRMPASRSAGVAAMAMVGEDTSMRT